MATKRIQPLPSYPPPLQGPRFNEIVVLDNSEQDRFAHQTLLSAIGLARKITTLSSPEELLSRLKSIERLDQVPEMIFIDLKYSTMDGFDFLEQFSKLSDFVRNRCKIAIVTASKNSDDRVKSFSDPHVVRFFYKPLDLFQLKEFIIPSN